MKTKRSRRARKGAAVAEIAVCLPMIIIIVFGAMEAASMLFLRQALIQSAYEGAKVAIDSRAENENAIAVAESVAAGRRITDLDVRFEPSDITEAAQGETVRVIVSAPGDSNSFINLGVFAGRTISAEAVMVKE